MKARRFPRPGRALLLTVLSLLPALSLLACTAPRSVSLSPEAAPRGSWRAGVEFGGNLPTQTAAALPGAIRSGVRGLWNAASGDSAAEVTADSLNGLFKGMLAYALDPLGTQSGLYLRYGFARRWDAGYRYAGGAHVLDVRYQFLGTDSLPAGAKAESDWRGSLAVQYCGQDYELPGYLQLDRLQGLLGFDLSRRDILVPLILGKTLGAEGRFGSFGIGLAYNLTFLEYASRVRKLVERLPGGGTRAFEDVSGERTISAYGAFANLRVGYRYAFLVASFSSYWQDYGRYRLFGEESVGLAGWTFMPALGLELRF